MIRCALAEMRRPSTEIRRRRRSSSSAVSTLGSTTTPLPITHRVSACRTPEGIRCSLNSSPSRTIVWPALLPPWKRITASARSASRSTILPLPSSPHWAPTITNPGIGKSVYGGERLAPVVPEQRQLVAHLGEPRHGALADLLHQLLALEVGRDHHRALLLVAAVDDRVQLLDHPRAGPLGAQVVDVEQVDGGQPVQE